MKTLKFALVPLLLVFAATLTSCEEEDTIRGVIITTTMNPAGVQLQSKSASSLVFSAGYVIVREVVFDGDIGDETTFSFTEEKITTIDLITGQANPPFVMNVPAGTYTSVYLGIEIQDETDKPSVVATGVYTDADGVTTPVRFEFNSGEVFEAESDWPVTIPESTPVTAKIHFDPHDWFATITGAQLDAAARTNGVIIVSESHNPGIFSIVADRLDDLTETEFR